MEGSATVFPSPLATARTNLAGPKASRGEIQAVGKHGGTLTLKSRDSHRPTRQGCVSHRSVLSVPWPQ